MKVLYVSRSHSGVPNPFVLEQASCMARYFPVQIEHYFIKNGFLKGYLKAIFQLPSVVKAKSIDIVHVHNGLSAFAVTLSKILFYRSMKIIVTFHGSDLNNKSKRRYSLIASRFSAHNILVSEKMVKFLNGNYSVVPCGINTDVQLKYRDITRNQNAWTSKDFIILFSSNFKRKEKDPEFAFKVVEAFSKSSNRDVKFIELKGYNREQLTMLMQAADVLIMCSIMEGSPQVIKEAVLNSLPVISNDVGDVAAICSGVDNCFIVKKEVAEYVDRLHYISDNNVRVSHRDPVLINFDNKAISEKLYFIYGDVANEG